jgi:hypothetical protein
MNLIRYASLGALAVGLSTGIGWAQVDSSAVADSLLLKQLQQAMQPKTPPPQQQAAPRSTLSTNPDVSAIGDFRSSYTSLGERKLDLYLNELELQVTSVVDPYARANFIYTFGKDLTTGAFESDLEIATLTSLTLPYQLQLTVGKFKPTIGKVNILHPHVFPFTDFPKIISNYFDDEGMYMEGASLSWLVPNPFDFYQELTLETGRIGAEPNASFVRGTTSQLTYSGHLKNFFDLTDNATLEFGLSGLNGPNRFGFSTSMAGADLTYKWKPVRYNVFQSFTWQSEILYSDLRLNPADVARTYGWYSLMEYQVAQRWFIGARYDHSGFPDDTARKEQAGSLLLRFQPTEFQILALEYQYTDRNFDRNTSQVTLRIIFGIGTHAAHQY